MSKDKQGSGSKPLNNNRGSETQKPSGARILKEDRSSTPARTQTNTTTTGSGGPRKKD